METQDTKNRFIELRAQGLSYDKIAKQLNISKQTLINWSEEFESVISNLKAIELETLMEKYYSLKCSRIMLFGEKLDAIKHEIEKRDLKDVPTEKLFELLAKYANILKTEGTDVVFSRNEDFLEVSMEGKTKQWKG